MKGIHKNVSFLKKSLSGHKKFTHFFPEFCSPLQKKKKDTKKAVFNGNTNKYQFYLSLFSL